MAVNPFGVQVKPIDYGDEFAPTTKTAHGLSIVCNNQTVGRINSWSPTSYSRTGVFIREINKDTWGLPIDYVPGMQNDTTIAMARAEVWSEEIEVAFGEDAEYANLCDQTKPFKLYEYLYRGATLYRVWVYLGVWFQEKNVDAITPDGDGVYRVSPTVAYVSKKRLK
jgi:hypothetical protein